MNPYFRRGAGPATTFAAWWLAVCWTSGCSTLLGIGDWANVIDGGEADSMTEDGSPPSADGAPHASRSESGSDVGMDATVDVGADGLASDGGLEAPSRDVGTDTVTPICADAACTIPASCAASGAGRTECGAGASAESCCTSLEVVGGTYDRTYTSSDAGPTGEADPATVSGFRLDKYLVTVGRFRSFVSAWNGGAGYTPPASSGKHTHLNGGRGLTTAGGGYEPGWVVTDDGNVAPTDANLACNANYPTWTSTAGSHENLQINCVNWYEAYAFCIWDGGFLPSEAEWEYAAAGGSQQREYPWGATAPGTANQYAIYGCDYGSDSGTCTGVANIAPVGTATLGAGLWGQLDLAGSVLEWNLDSYAAYADPCVDCADLSTASNRVLRGGNFGSPTSYLQPTYRINYAPADRYYYFGIRCARTP